MNIIAVKIHEDTRSYLPPFMKYTQEPQNLEEYEMFLKKGEKGKGGLGFHECMNFKVYSDGLVRFYLPPGYVPAKEKRKDLFTIVWVSYCPYKILGIQFDAQIYDSEHVRKDSVFSYYSTPLSYHGIVEETKSVLFSVPMELRIGRHIPVLKAWGNGLRYLKTKHLKNILHDEIRILEKQSRSEYEKKEFQRLKKMLLVRQNSSLKSCKPDRDLGEWGENIVYQDQIKKVNMLDLPATKVVHTSQTYPQCEYDIESVYRSKDNSLEPLYIEVKTTQTMKRPSILISKRQIDFAREHCKNHTFAFVDADLNKIRYLSLDEVENEFIFNVEKYRLVKKTMIKKNNVKRVRAINPSEYSKMAVSVFNESVDYEQENNDILDDIRRNLEERINHPQPSIRKHNVKDDGSFTMYRLSGSQRKAFNDKWNQLEYLVKFVFHDTSIHGSSACIDGVCFYKIEKNDGKISLKQIEASFPFCELEDAFVDKLNDDDFKFCIQDNAITLHLLEEIMP